MKKILLATLAILSINSIAAEIGGSVSTGYGSRQSIYKGKEDFFVPVWANIQYENFYLKGTELGAKFIDTRNFDAYAFVEFLDGYSIRASKMDTGYKSINKRNYQQAVGLKSEIKLGDYLENFSLNPYVMAGKRGTTAGANLSTYFKPIERLVIGASIGADFLSKKYTDYYFGVDKDELGRNINREYSPKSAFAFTSGIFGEFYFTRTLSASAFINFKKYSSEVTNSPITEDKILTNVGAALKYSF